MTAYNCLYLIAIALVMMMGWGTLLYAADTGVGASSSSATTALAPDGTPVVHKSFHKKRKSTASIASDTSNPLTAPPLPSSSITVSKTASETYSIPIRSVGPSNPGALGPTVETGLPVARHADGEVAYIPPASGAPSGLQGSRSTLGNGLPLSTPGSVTPSTTISSYSASDRTTSSGDGFVFANFSHKAKNTYPWKTQIITTMFYIGEGGSSISSTTNHASSWDQEWEDSNRGSDNPYDRNGYASGSHASTVNPFYIALPFNDLVYPDKARQWLPPGWHRPNKDGKPVSACKDRWVEIKTEDGSGHICYAQWEDVGPLRYDHAEYVFGPERPDTYTRAGLDVSPAVAQYLGIDGEKRSTTRWRFVDDEDVPPGAWLKYEEQAVIYEALHSLKNASPLGNSSLSPVQKTSEPIEDQSMLDTSRKKVGAAKG
jgi:hypothetical protein